MISFEFISFLFTLKLNLYKYNSFASILTQLLNILNGGEYMSEKEKKKNKLLSPKMDIVFQVLFGEVGSEEITKEFLEAILKKKIYKVDLSRNPVLRRITTNDKIGILDVIVQINDSEICNIEMQVAKRNDMIQRILYYWSKTYVRNIHKNEEYNCLNKTIGIIITDFKINGLENLDYFTNWKIIETEGRETILTDYFELYIIELPKIYNKRQGEEDKLFEWMRFLENPVSREVEVIMKNNDGIKKAKEKLEEISNDEIMQKLAEWKEAAAHDEASTIATAKIEEKRNIAIKMIRNGIKLDLIKEITGLSEEEIKTLANK